MGMTIKWRDKTCERCGKPYPPRGPAQRLCDACWPIKTCQECGNEFTLNVEERRKHRGGRLFCDTCIAAKRGAPSSRRAQEAGGTGRRRVTKAGGYVEVNLGYQPASDYRAELPRRVHPEGYIYLGRVKEHRWWMRRRIGRELTRDEEVHHRNLDRADNDRFCKACGAELGPELDADDMLRCPCGWKGKPNLELWLTSQPKGARWQDLLEHALDVGLRSEPAAARELMAKRGYVPIP